ncbi:MULTISPECIES: fluoride efflux transporter CrcB [Thermoactinomyces]|jgi:fluoride exporter|uniref:Fluoride-specific ion channel FluC n=1 Tax=Thermoactinomyces daqus TaxID=1329516 RepID=A0A7W1XB00_9BACL|nr:MULTISPECIES: fluoride efflux transporter CrcB [Thermoactinomyces]MBA4543279.1 fluoride efflux transporter CrcB [Thermoactinomyces daqus]MBH8599566.1 fluoride efflux transporter CrcB [Thermoactinomyces sp. CICC 10523]MBH8605699.1 fluoride efflux transporter CrcB [Thermoactinomyces sp. CICC 10522]MBH8608901.1 fluoride efflux transporter CrcB [Thermoactinomyces sp. CICC 10521]
MVYLAIGATGMLGALLRYWLGIWIPTAWIWGFPLGTLFINLAGSFLLSVFSVWFTRFPKMPSWLKTGITTGFIGSFTTFSTFNVELLTFMQHHAWIMALSYLWLSLVGGLFFSWSGWRIGKNLAEREKEPEVVPRS